MTFPLATLACVTVLLGIFGTPAWPWFQSFLENTPATASFAAFNNGSLLGVMLVSTLIVFLGLGLGWKLYGGSQTEHAAEFDTVQRSAPAIFHVLHRSFFVDEFYAATVVRLNGWLSRAFDWLDTWIWGGAVWTVSQWVLLLARLDNFFDTFVVNGGFDEGCAGLTRNGRILSMLQDGRVQRSLRAVGVGLVLLALFLLWGARG
jgi:NADH-quinone oxidoreductase subunit L